MKTIQRKNFNKQLRHRRSRALVAGTAKRPRLSVFRSNKHMYAQLIDDEHGLTLAAAGDSAVSKKKDMHKVDVARAIGRALGEAAKKAKITEAVFHRSSYRYHGRVRALAEGARESGLKF